MKHVYKIIGILGVIALAGCEQRPRTQDERMALAIGDSMLAWNSVTGRSAPQVLGRMLGFRVQNDSRSGARVGRGGNIPSQYTDGDWEFVLVNGGANDLIFRCNCSASCAPVLEELAGTNGQGGALPRLIDRIHGDGHRVVYTGYHRARQMNAPLRHCADDLDELDRRMGLYAQATPGVTFADISDVFPPADTSYYFLDRIHPSAKGSRAIAAALANVLSRAGIVPVIKGSDE